MDITKWKSVAIKIEDHNLLKAICDKKYSAECNDFKIIK